MNSWETFTRRIIIDRPIGDIFQLWTTGKGLTTWFLKTADYTTAENNKRPDDENYQVGDEYLWEWHNWDGSSKGKVLAQNGEDHLKFEFADGVVDVKITKYKDGRSLVTLVQSNIPTDDESRMNIFCGCSCGWSFWLTNLKAYMEHGILLNEKNADLRGEFSGFEVVNT